MSGPKQTTNKVSCNPGDTFLKLKAAFECKDQLEKERGKNFYIEKTIIPPLYQVYEVPVCPQPMYYTDKEDAKVCMEALKKIEGGLWHIHIAVAGGGLSGFPIAQYQVRRGPFLGCEGPGSAFATISSKYNKQEAERCAVALTQGLGQPFTAKLAETRMVGDIHVVDAAGDQSRK